MQHDERCYDLGSRRSVIRELFEYGKKRKAEIGEENVFDFSLGNPSVAPPKEIKETLLALIENEDATALHGYTSAQGDAATRKTIAENLNARYGVGITPDLIYMTCAAAASLTITLKALLHEGDEVVVFAPFFTEYRVFIENAGGKVVVSLPAKKTFQADVNDLAARITPKTRAVIVNSPNNPSGVVYTEETIKAIADLLKEKSAEYGEDILLISDEPYRELVYDGVTVPFIMNYYDNSVVCYSYSKALSLPGERIGYIAVSPKMHGAKDFYLAVCGAGRSLGYVCAPSLFQRVIARCDGLKSDVSAYKENRDILCEGLKAAGYEFVKPDGAFYLFIKALESDACAFAERAKKHELLVVPCDDFGVKGYVRVAYCVDKKTIVNSIPHFEALAKEYK